MKEKIVLVVVLVSLVVLGSYIYTPIKAHIVDGTDDAGISLTKTVVPNITDAGMVDAGL